MRNCLSSYFYPKCIGCSDGTQIYHISLHSIETTWMNPSPQINCSAAETIINSRCMRSFCPFTFKPLRLLVLSWHLFVSKPATKRLETNDMQKVTFGNEGPLQNECLQFSSDKTSTFQCVYRMYCHSLAQKLTSVVGSIPWGHALCNSKCVIPETKPK